MIPMIFSWCNLFTKLWHRTLGQDPQNKKILDNLIYKGKEYYIKLSTVLFMERFLRKMFKSSA